MEELKTMFIKCFAPLSFLIELSRGRKLSGYDVVKHMKGFGLEVSPGTVYPQIRRLEREGLVEASHADDSVVYTLTEEGLRLFRGFIEDWRKPLTYVYQNLCVTT
jgi:PadR family transcriptional regulator PadR